MRVSIILKFLIVLMIVIFFSACGRKKNNYELADLSDKVFGVPSGTIADVLVKNIFPDAEILYFESVSQAVNALRAGKVDAVAYDEPVLRNIVAKSSGLRILDELISYDFYGLAVRLDNVELKNDIDKILDFLKKTGIYDDMLRRWLPEQGAPQKMPTFDLIPQNGILRFGTASVVEPFSFYDESGTPTGFDIELAYRIAEELGMGLEITNMQFGALIPSLLVNRVDMIGSCITITDERANSVLFSAPYYIGGIATMVRD